VFGGSVLLLVLAGEEGVFLDFFSGLLERVELAAASAYSSARSNPFSTSDDLSGRALSFSDSLDETFAFFFLAFSCSTPSIGIRAGGKAPAEEDDTSFLLVSFVLAFFLSFLAGSDVEDVIGSGGGTEGSGGGAEGSGGGRVVGLGDVAAGTSGGGGKAAAGGEVGDLGLGGGRLSDDDARGNTRDSFDNAIGGFVVDLLRGAGTAGNGRSGAGLAASDRCDLGDITLPNEELLLTTGCANPREERRK
jgi:hypothetical protein